MTYDHELILVTHEDGENELGDPIKVPVKRSVLAGVESVTRGEHYQAAATGLRPEVVFVLNVHEYQGEREVEFEGRPYTVVRSFTRRKTGELYDFEAVELICVEAKGG